MASQRQDFLRKINKGWSPVHMNLIKPKVGFHKPKKQDETKVIESDAPSSSEEKPK